MIVKDFFFKKKGGAINLPRINFTEDHNMKALNFIYKAIQWLLGKALEAVLLCLSNQNMCMQVLAFDSAVIRLIMTAVPWGPLMGYLACTKQQVSE